MKKSFLLLCLLISGLVMFATPQVQNRIRPINRNRPTTSSTQDKAKSESYEKAKQEISNAYNNAQSKVKETMSFYALKEKLKTDKFASGLTDKEKKVLTRLVNSMVAVDGGESKIGVSRSEDTEGNQSPELPVKLSSFYICKYEVDQELWETVMGSNPCRFKEKNNPSVYPVESVSYNDCEKFVAKLNSMTGLKFAIPTEAQWEYAARGGQKSKGYKYAGSNDPTIVINCDNKSNVTTRAPGRFGYAKPNELGIYDMSGNVSEWTTSGLVLYEQYPGASSASKSNPLINPKGGSSTSRKVIRGGHFGQGEKQCTVTYRAEYTASQKFNGLGLRLICMP